MRKNIETRTKPKIPPNQNKYNWHLIKLGEEIFIDGDFHLIRTAANSYGKNHDIRFFVRQRTGGAIVERYK